MPGASLGTGATAVNETDRVPALRGKTVIVQVTVSVKNSGKGGTGAGQHAAGKPMARRSGSHLRR